MDNEVREVSRRTLIRGAAAGISMATLPNWFVREARAAEAEAELLRPRRIGQNDTINIGVIGPGGPKGGFQQGLGVTRWLAGKQGVKIVAVCDVDEAHRQNAARVLNVSADGIYRDYRKMLRHKDLDAVVIGTPDHWHAQISVDAMVAGKDVYCEKPLTLGVAEGREVADTAKRLGRIFQTGSQQRSDGRFRLAVQVARSGRLGRLTKIITHLPTGPTGGPFASKPIPEGLDWNMWLGPAPVTEYVQERCHGNFRWWLEYSGGMLTDWGAHHNDIAQWAMDMDGSGPISVQGTGKVPAGTGSGFYSTFPEFDVEYLYPNGVVLHCTNQGENGLEIHGEEGWVFVSRGRIGASDPKLLEEPVPGSEKVYASNDHAQNFIDGIRTRKACICNAEVGHRSVSVCHLANISLRLGGRKLRWDPVDEKFVGDPEANLMLLRPHRDWER